MLSFLFFSFPRSLSLFRPVIYILLIDLLVLFVPPVFRSIRLSSVISFPSLLYPTLYFSFFFFFPLNPLPFLSFLTHLSYAYLFYLLRSLLHLGARHNLIPVEVVFFCFVFKHFINGNKVLNFKH